MSQYLRNQMVNRASKGKKAPDGVSRGNPGTQKTQSPKQVYTQVNLKPDGRS